MYNYKTIMLILLILWDQEDHDEGTSTCISSSADGGITCTSDESEV